MTVHFNVKSVYAITLDPCPCDDRWENDTQDHSSNIAGVASLDQHHFIELLEQAQYRRS
jgi:hypothetical protein